jgi:L-histidine N-alpha-methyltransferase
MEYTLETINKSNTYSIKNYLPEIGIDKVREELLRGLTSSPKYIPSKYFYDEKGSLLFEEITKLEEYYPTRTEKSILKNILPKLNLDFGELSIIELGSGDPSKISLIFDQISEEYFNQIKYFPIDISKSAIENSASILSDKYEGLIINGIVTDFIHQVQLIPDVKNKLICFFGSTIGNLTRDEIYIFLKELGSVMNKGDNLILGIDLVKDAEVLEKAYNDGNGITAEFNKNILNVVNKLTGTNFNPDLFEHVAFFNQNKKRIEMHLRAEENMEVQMNGSSKEITIHQGELIHTENSHKFKQEDILQFAEWGNSSVGNVFTDQNKWFSLVHFRK